MIDPYLSNPVPLPAREGVRGWVARIIDNADLLPRSKMNPAPEPVGDRPLL